MQVAPLKELLPFIKHYLFLQGNGKSVHRLRLFSDGNMGMVIATGGVFTSDLRHNALYEPLPACFLYGQITTHRDVWLAGNTSLVIVVFQPDGLHRLLDIPAPQITDLIVDVQDLFGKEAPALSEKIMEQKSPEERLHLLNHFFTSWLIKKQPDVSPIVAPTLKYIQKSKGLVALSQLVTFTGYSERQIERKFHEVIGMGPKRYISIIKLHHFLKQLSHGHRSDNFTSLAYEAGYADQSHLIKEFRKHTGMTPRSYHNQPVRFAVNLVSTPA